MPTLRREKAAASVQLYMATDLKTDQIKPATPILVLKYK